MFFFYKLFYRNNFIEIFGCYDLSVFKINLQLDIVQQHRYTYTYTFRSIHSTVNTTRGLICGIMDMGDMGHNRYTRMAFGE